MITKGFLMFWGGIVGLTVTILLAVTIAISASRKRKIESGKIAQLESIKSDKIGIEKATVDNKRNDIAISQTDVIVESVKKTLPDTQLIDK